MKNLIKTHALILFLLHVNAHGMNNDPFAIIDQNRGDSNQNRRDNAQPTLLDQYISNFLLPAPQNTNSETNPVMAHEESNDLPSGLFLVLPPTDKQQDSYSRLPQNTCIVLPKSLIEPVPNPYITKVISLMESEHYAQAASELNQIKELSAKDLPALTILAQTIYGAYEHLQDQKQTLWDDASDIGIAGCCCWVLNEPLKHILPAPPETVLALFSSTAYLVYNCWRHAQHSQHITAIDKYVSNVSVVPPMYTLVLPPPAVAMENEPSSSTTIPRALALESTNKKAYDECRRRTFHKQLKN